LAGSKIVVSISRDDPVFLRFKLSGKKHQKEKLLSGSL